MSCGSLSFKQTDVTRAVKALRKNDPWLHRYATRQRSQRRGKGFDLRSLPYARLWYVYQGMITLDRIIEIAKECNVSGRIAA